MFGDNYESAPHPRHSVYFAPSRTLLTAEARRLGIRDEQDLYGGVVPAEFMASKAINHPLVDESACAPRAWSFEFEARVRPVVHRGYTVFSMRDAQRIGEKLVEVGPVRVKPTRASGACGQIVVTDPAGLIAVLAGLTKPGCNNVAWCSRKI
jgi:hypothetical protein